MNKQKFTELAAQGYHRIPLMKEVLADLDTPLSTYLKLADAPYSYLLESVQGGEKWGRYSIIGLPCQRLIRVNGYCITVEENGQILESITVPDPLEWIETYQAEHYKIPDIDELPRFTGGLVGYFGFDTVRYIEPRLANTINPDPLNTPDILLLVSEEVVVFDNLSGKLFIIIHANPAEKDAFEKGQKRLDTLTQKLNTHAKPPYSMPERTVDESEFQTGFARKDFEAAINRIKEYIIEGDAMQVVLSQRLSIPFEAPPLNLYRALRCINPSPYLFFMNMGDFHIVGSSPEILVRLEDNEVTVRPMAGTRPRGKTVTEDKALEEDLLADPKECAEHLMLIDLGRNDVGRVAKTSTVQLTDKMAIERYSHVMHIVSNVTGQLNPDHSTMDVLRATFPAGTLSGAPKIRAMEIIDELEPVKRGIYGGAVGYIGWNGNMDTAIAIRTAVIKDDWLHIQAGAGIVADSVPASEWEECMNKGRAIFKAVAMVAEGLDAPAPHK